MASINISTSARKFSVKLRKLTYIAISSAKYNSIPLSANAPLRIFCSLELNNFTAVGISSTIVNRRAGVNSKRYLAKPNPGISWLTGGNDINNSGNAISAEFLPFVDVNIIIVTRENAQIVGIKNAVIVSITQLVAIKLNCSFFSLSDKFDFAISSVTTPMVSTVISDLRENSI
jgi:hypothetical protein